jgi:hypothetical protein
LSSEEGVARSLLNLGFAAWQRSKHGEAEALMKESVRRFTTIGSREGIAYCLEGLAAVAMSRLEGARAARLLGASEAVCENLELTLDPFEQALHGWTTAQTRTQLGDEAFAVELAAGRALSVDEAAGYALSESAGEAIAVAGG